MRIEGWAPSPSDYQIAKRRSAFPENPVISPGNEETRAQPIHQSWGQGAGKSLSFSP